MTGSEDQGKRSYANCEDGDVRQRPAGADIAAEIVEKIQTNDIIIFMQSFCGFSRRALALLDSYKTPYTAIDMRDDVEMRETLKQVTNWPTIPQIFIKGEFLGGCDDIHELHAIGELQRKIESAVASRG